jgi:hypothetical protein
LPTPAREVGVGEEFDRSASAMEIETPSIQAVVAANGGPTPSPKEDRMARLGAEAKDDEMVALHAAEKAARAEEEEDDYYLAEADDNEADAREFRDTWNRLFSDVYGCFEDTSELLSLSPIRSDPWNLSLFCKFEPVLNL